MDSAHKIMSEVLDHYYDIIDTFKVVIVSSRYDGMSSLLMALRPGVLPIIIDFHAPSLEAELFNALRIMSRMSVPVKEVYVLCPGGVARFTSSRENLYETLHKFSKGLKVVCADPVTCMSNEPPDAQLSFLRHCDMDSALPEICSLHRLRSSKLCRQNI